MRIRYEFLHTHTHSQQSLQRPAAPAGTGLGAKARVAQNLGEICRGECGSWVRNLIQIYHDKKRFAATKSAEDSNKILAKAYTHWDARENKRTYWALYE